MPTWVTFSGFTVTMLTYGRVRKPVGDEFRTSSGVSGSRKKNHRHQTPLDLESSHFDGWDSFSRRENSRMAIYKRYKGRRLKRTDADWDQGTWWIEFSLQGQYIHQSVPGARTLAQAQRAESQIREGIYERRYIPGKNSSLSLSMKHSYHGRRRTSAVTARMNSARLRSKISLVRSICGTSSQ